MDLRTQRYFVTVAQELNFTRAAKKLNMSQPPLWNAMKALEDDLGTQLFIRGRRQLALTRAGEVFLRRSKQMLALSEKTRQEIAACASMQGTVRIGAANGQAFAAASDWIASFRNRHPGTTIDVRTGEEEEVLEELEGGLLDLAVISLPYDTKRFEGQIIASEPWRIMIREEHPLARNRQEDISAASLADEPLIFPRQEKTVAMIREWFRREGLDPRPVLTLGNRADALEMVRKNIGIALFPSADDSPAPGITIKTPAGAAGAVEYAVIRAMSYPVEQFSPGI